MGLLSDKDVLGLVDHLCLASITPLSPKKQKRLYWLMSTAVTHLEAIKEERVINIRANLLQNLADRDPNTLQKLSDWLRTRSIKKNTGELCGAIVPFQKLFCSCLQPEETTQGLIQATSPPFSISNYINNICDTLVENTHLEETINTIISLISCWQDSAKDESKAINKEILINETKSLIEKIKNMENDQFNVLCFIISQKTKEFEKYLWNRIASREAQNFPLLKELMQLIFDTYPLPETYQAANRKPGVTSFSDLIGLADLRKSQFVELAVLKKLFAVSSKDRENTINDCIDQINRGAFSNLSLNLNSISALCAFFGEENYKKLTRLNLENDCLQTLSREENKKHTENLLNTLSQEFPRLTHLSLNSYFFNPASEMYLGKLKELQSLKLIASEDSSQLDFLKELTKLQELQITISHDVDLTSLLKLSELKTLNIWLKGEGNLKILEQLTWLENLDLTTSITDISFLQHLKNIKNLKVNGFFKTLHLENLPHLLTLRIEKCKDVQQLRLSKLPLLETLSLKGTRADCVLENLPNLTELDLGSSILNPIDLESSTKLSKLTFCRGGLFLNSRFLLKLPLQSLNISNSKVSDISGLSLLPELTELNICNCTKLSDIELYDVLKYPSLKKLLIDDRVLPETFKLRLQEKNITLVIVPN